MKNKGWVGLAAVVLVFIIIYSLNNQNTPQLHATTAVDTLTGNRYCLRYTSKWIFSDEQPVEFVEIKDGPLRFQKYDNYDGSSIITLTENGISKVFVNGDLLQEIQEPETNGETPVKMRYNGKRGTITLEDTPLSFEEYSCTYNKSDFTLRFLFFNESLWGIQYGDDGHYVKVLELTESIPEEYKKLYKSE